MSKSYHPSFRVEALEQRVLLSAVPLDGGQTGEEGLEELDFSTLTAVESDSLGGFQGDSGEGAAESNFGSEYTSSEDDMIFAGATEMLLQPDTVTSFTAVAAAAEPVSLLEFIFPDYLSLSPDTTPILDLTPTSDLTAVIGIGEGTGGDYNLDAADLEFLSDFDQVVIGSASTPFSFDLGAVYYKGGLSFQGDAVNGTLTAIGNGIEAGIQVGDFRVGVSNASFGMFIDGTGKVVLEARGTLFSSMRPTSH
jgi:hypothetical protein